MAETDDKTLDQLLECLRNGDRGDGQIEQAIASIESLRHHAHDAAAVRAILQASEQTARLALKTLEFHIDNSPLAVVEWGPDLCWLRWSAGAQRIFGYTAEEMIGESFVAQPFMHEEDAATVKRQIDQMLRGELPRFSSINRNYRKDGTVIWCEWHNSSLTDRDGQVVSVLSQAADVTDRVTAERELREARQILESHLDNSSLAIVEWGPDFRFRRWSRGAERIYGYTQEEMIGRQFDTMDPPLIHPEDMPRAMAHVERMLSGKTMRDSVTARNFRKDGSIVWMNWHGSSLYDGDGNLVSVLSSGIEITDRIIAEQSLRESESYFRAAFELTLVGMTQVDPITRRYLSVNQQFCQMTGYSEQELKQMDPFQITHPEDLPRLIAHAERIVAGQSDHYVDQRRCIRKDGRVIWLHVAATLLREPDGRPLRVISAAIDITERVEVEQRLRESERRLGLLVSNLPGMAYRCRNDPQWTMLFASERAIDLTGYPAGDLTSGKVIWSDLLHPEETDRIWEIVQAAVRMRRPFQIEYRLRHRDGTWRWMWEQGQGVYDSSGELLALEGFITEVTQRKLAEQQISAAKDRAEAASRAKDRFIASLSHELRTPLTPARALLSVLRDDARLPADVRADLQIVHRNVMMESRLIDDLLDITRLARGDIEIDPQDCDLHPLLEAAVTNLASTPEADGLMLHKDLSAKEHRAFVDQRRMQQIVSNLLANAAKFTPAGGSVTVATDNPDDRSIRLRVIDTGVGIPAEHIQRIFEPFERGEALQRYQYTGLGLGLTIASSLTQKMNGTIEAHSEGPGRGSTFSVTVPLTRSIDAQRREAQSTGPQPAPGGAQLAVRPLMNLSVLLVEDHSTTAEILSRLLTRIGCRTIVASTMAAGLEAAAGSRFDLIVSDIGLPDGTGHDLLRILRQRGVDTPAIALSGFGMSSDLAASQAAGFAQHLTKPIDFDSLHLSIVDALKR